MLKAFFLSSSLAQGIFFARSAPAESQRRARDLAEKREQGKQQPKRHHF